MEKRAASHPSFAPLSKTDYPLSLSLIKEPLFRFLFFLNFLFTSLFLQFQLVPSLFSTISISDFNVITILHNFNQCYHYFAQIQSVLSIFCTIPITVITILHNFNQCYHYFEQCQSVLSLYFTAVYTISSLFCTI